MTRVNIAVTEVTQLARESAHTLANTSTRARVHNGTHKCTRTRAHTRIHKSMHARTCAHAQKHVYYVDEQIHQFAQVGKCSSFHLSRKS